METGLSGFDNRKIQKLKSLRHPHHIFVKVSASVQSRSVTRCINKLFYAMRKKDPLFPANFAMPVLPTSPCQSCLEDMNDWKCPTWWCRSMAGQGGDVIYRSRHPALCNLAQHLNAVQQDRGIVATQFRMCRAAKPVFVIKIMLLYGLTEHGRADPRGIPDQRRKGPPRRANQDRPPLRRRANHRARKALSVSRRGPFHRHCRAGKSASSRRARQIFYLR